jgi:putative two-component system response regulator
LIAGDKPDNIAALTGILQEDYQLHLAASGEQTLEAAMLAAPPDLVLLETEFSRLDGFQLCRRMKSDPRTRRLPVILILNNRNLEDEAKALEMGAVDYISRPISPAVVKTRVQTHLALKGQTKILERMVRERTAELQSTRLEVIRRLSLAVEFRDTSTGLHIIRMSHYSRLLARAAGMDSEEADLLLNAAPMHDIGKIGISERILLKTGNLTPEEWKSMQSHTTIGAKIIENHSRLLETARVVALTHHEKWDGKGYPYGLKGERIPFVGRVVAIADVFDALTSDRPYKRAWSIEDALELIRRETGYHFDPKLSEIFLEVIPDILQIRDKYSEG